MKNNPLDISPVKHYIDDDKKHTDIKHEMSRFSE